MKYLAAVGVAISFLLCCLVVFTGSNLTCEFVKIAIFSAPCGLLSSLYLLILFSKRSF